MRDRRESWKLYVVAQTFPARSPSQIMGIESDWAAYCFDAAVSLWGNWVERKLSERTNVGMPKHSLDNLMAGRLGRSMSATIKALGEM